MLRDHDAVLDGEAELAAGIAEEILAILLGLEAEQIVGQHRRDQLAMIGHALHHRGDRPRRMQEEADRIVDAEIAQLRAEREEMIILHPERRLGLAEAHQGARHEGVDLAIADIVVARDADQIAARMQRRPQRRIGKTFVIAAVMRRRQIQRRNRARSERFDLGERFLLMAITHAARGTHPDRTRMFHHRQARPPQGRPSWVRWVCRAQRDLKRRLNSQVVPSCSFHPV